MSDWGRPSRWDDLATRDKLRISFGRVAEWAGQPAGPFDALCLSDIRKSALKMQDFVGLPNVSTLLQYMGGIREDLQRLVDLERTLKARPSGDPDRCNPAVRTALRRAKDFLAKEGATFQYC